MPPDIFERILFADRRKVLIRSLAAALLIAALDFFVKTVSLAILYVIPLGAAAFFLSYRQVMGCAVVAALLRDVLGTSPLREAPADFALGLVAYGGLGLFVVEMVESRKRQAVALGKLQAESELRKRAEQEARAVIESSPTAILTVDSQGCIQMANRRAKRLLALEETRAEGRPIAEFFPILGDLFRSKRAFRSAGTMLEGGGVRSNSEHFVAQMWVSSYETSAGTQMTVVVADVSDQLRDREELGLRQLLMSSRIIAGAVSHEIRNLAAAAHALHSNIGKSGGMDESHDFQALGELVEGMRRLATAEIPSADQVLTGVDVNALLRELNIIVRAEAEDAGIEFTWQIADNLPRVRAEHSGLLQVLLNLTHNSIRALKETNPGRIAVSAYTLEESVLLRFSDDGPGIATPEGLFQPFQAGATATGLGLCISRAIIRTFGGELRYLNQARQGYFLIDLPAAPVGKAAGNGG